MRHKNILFVFFVLWLAVFTAQAQTDVAASLLGAFSTTSTGGNTGQTPSNAAGGLLELRHAWNPSLSFEITYAYNRANQLYRNIGAVPAVCINGSCAGLPTIPISANAHTFTADWIPSQTRGTLRPFAVLGGGVALFVPTGGQTNTTSATKPVFVFGLGADWARWQHWSLRLQYRGNLYAAPLLTTQYIATGSPMLTNEPTLGMYYHWK